MEIFGDRLKQLREEKGYSQQELAEMINVSRSSVGMFEQGTREPNFETLEAIADVFNVDLDYIFGRTNVKRCVPITDNTLSTNKINDTYTSGLSTKTIKLIEKLEGLPEKNVDDVLSFAEFQQHTVQAELLHHQEDFHKS